MAGINSLFSIMGFRRNLLDHLYRGVNIGMAWNRNHFVLILDYEGDYVEYDQLPTITGNILRCSGRVKNRARLQGEDDLAVDIWYDPLPQPLTVGQLLRVNAYDYGTIVASLRRPLSGGYQWTEDWGSIVVEGLTQPEAIPANAPVPVSLDERLA